MVQPIRAWRSLPITWLAFCLPPLAAQAARSVQCEVPGFEKSLYFRLDAQTANAPPTGYGLLVVMPGGNGSAEFAPWFENGILSQAPGDFVGAMVVAPKWEPEPKIIWPTKKDEVPGKKYDTEDYVRAVVADVQKHCAIDPKRILLLTWSSSGPVAYTLAAAEPPTFTAFYIAMAVFRQPSASGLAHTKGVRFLLDQSPDDQVTPIRFAKQAQKVLTDAGAVVRLVTYKGGHGWNDRPMERVHEGLRWLLSNEPPPPAGAMAEKPAAKGNGANLLQNGGFEAGEKGWDTVNNSGTLSFDFDKKTKHEGKVALHLVKTGALPLDLVKQEVELAAGDSLSVHAWVKCKGCGNAFVKFFLYDEKDEVVNEDPDLVQLHGDQDWQQLAKSWPAGTGKRAVFQVVMVLPGEVWLDDVQVQAAKAEK